MSELELAAGLVSTVGFPIAMCLLLLWQNHTVTKDLKMAIEANTLATNTLAVLVNERVPH